MASHILRTNSTDEDFEIIDSPVDVVAPNSKHNAATCGSPLCQLSHVSREVELASERNIEFLVMAMQATAKELEAKGPIFHISMEERNTIFDTFSAELPVKYRQIMNCSTCKQFMRQSGDLCIVSEDGGLVPLLWPTDNVPPYYKQSVEAVLKLFDGKTVGDEFKIQSEKGRILGRPTNGGWNHMSITLEKTPIARTNSSQDTATSYTMLERIIQDNSPEVIARVHHLIHDNQLPYVESHKAPIEYLRNTVEGLGDINHHIKRKNLITKYARAAFPGCLSSLRGGMIGYLFECVREKQTFETLEKNWANKAKPLSYLRPTAAPSVGNIESAEKIFAGLGYEPRDLERVFLTLDQVPESAKLWSPTINPTPPSVSSDTSLSPQKIFNTLLPAATRSIAQRDYDDAPTRSISFRQFVLKIIPTVSDIECLIPQTPIQPYFFTTGKEGSKPVMSFHREEEGAHTASWYAWATAWAASSAGLKAGNWVPVKAVISFPHMWDEFPSAIEAIKDDNNDHETTFKFARHGIRFLFVLDGIKEGIATRELCLFPTFMKGEFHSVRKTVEAYSKKGRIEQPEEGKQRVGGLSVEKNTEKEVEVRVRTKTGQYSRFSIKLFE